MTEKKHKSIVKNCGFVNIKIKKISIEKYRISCRYSRNYIKFSVCLFILLGFTKWLGIRAIHREWW